MSIDKIDKSKELMINPLENDYEEIVFSDREDLLQKSYSTAPVNQSQNINSSDLKSDNNQQVCSSNNGS